MKSVKLSYFYNLGFSLNSMTHLRNDVPADLRHGITYTAWTAVHSFAEDTNVKYFLPKSHDKATPLAKELELWAKGIYEDRTIIDYEDLRRAVESLSVTLVDELDRVYSYSLTGKGNLSLAKLVEGASQGYGPEIVTIIDSSVSDEIDEAGRCLAFTMYTACGFHVLRSVEICIKALLHALTGALPKLNKRNWGEYISQLENAGVSANLIDTIKILKAKRNPLMHPQDSLGETEAIDIFCICQAATGALVEEVTIKALQTQFGASLKLLPNL